MLHTSLAEDTGFQLHPLPWVDGWPHDSGSTVQLQVNLKSTRFDYWTSGELDARIKKPLFLFLFLLKWSVLVLLLHSLLQKDLLSRSHDLFKPKPKVLALRKGRAQGTFPRALPRAVQLHTIRRKASPFLNYPRHCFNGHEIHRLTIKLNKPQAYRNYLTAKS